MSFLRTRRFILSLIAIIGLVCLMAVINVARFDHRQWLSSQLSLISVDASALPQPASITGLSSHLIWKHIELPLSQGGYFEAQQVTVKLNLLSIVLGRPSIDAIDIEHPYFESSPDSLSIAWLRSVPHLKLKQLSISNAILAIADTELHELNVEWLKNGSLGDYSIQSSGHLRQNTLDLGFNYSGRLSFANDGTLTFRKNNLASQTFFDQGAIEWVAKIKQLEINPNNAIQLDFASWSSHWQQQRLPYLPANFDFAGGLEFGAFNESNMHLTLLDAALAFRDSDNIARTYALQSTSAQASNTQINGQLSVSILAEQPQSVIALEDWQSYNFVMSGQIHNNQPFTSWLKPEFRLAIINGHKQRLSHNIALKELTLDSTHDRWLLKDGDWNEFLDDNNMAGYGFGTLSLHWPTLKVIEGPTVTERLQPPLNLLATDMETINALHRLLVQ